MKMLNPHRHIYMKGVSRMSDQATSMYIRKEKEEKSTIKNIKNILDCLGFDITIRDTYHVGLNLYSVRLEFEFLPGIGVNGKGITYEIALASAYAEFMERLQSRVLIRPNYGLKSNPMFYFSDESISKDYANSALISIFSNIKDSKTKEMLKLMIDNEERYQVVSNFYHINSKTNQLMPSRIVSLLCRSNGLSSGNTYEEALVQATCEIIERYVTMEIFKQQWQLNSIDPKSLSINGALYYSELFKSFGLEMLIKDCTLGGKFPALGVLIYNQQKTEYKFSIGCDPDINIAFQRAVTELVQGMEVSENRNTLRLNKMDLTDKDRTFIWEDKQDSPYWQWQKEYIHRSGSYPMGLFNNEISDAFQVLSPFIKEKGNNAQAWAFIKESLISQEYQIYIKDYSYLGFPTVRVYIPGMSEIELLNSTNAMFYINYNHINQFLLNMREESIDNDKLFILDAIQGSAKFAMGGKIKTILSLIGVGDTDIFKIPCNTLLGVICNVIGNDDLTHKYFSRDLDNNLLKLLFILSKEQSSFYDQDYMAQIENSIDAENIAKISECMKLHNLYSLFNFPSCPSCSMCSIKDNCKYELWYNINCMLEKQQKQYYTDQFSNKKLVEEIS